ncbi:MAG: hypothetical protein ACTTI6_05265 [Treponema sp.]|uniref:hypothetical protein n=1 Tax=Treponema sp. TaxID=166 RepID=UPI003FA1AE41
MKKNLSLFALFALIIGSALFMSSCGAKIQADSVWQVTKAGGVSFEAQKIYVCFGADGKVIGATNMSGSLVKASLYTGDYTAKNGKIKAPFTANVECDFQISGETMTISKSGTTTYEFKKVTKPTAKEVRDAK